MNGIGCFMALSLESSISFLMSIFRQNLTVPFFKYCCFFVVLVVPNFFARIWNSFTEANNSVLFNLHFVCTIITVVNLNNFKYHTKIRLCSQANQNHLLHLSWSFLLPIVKPAIRHSSSFSFAAGSILLQFKVHLLGKPWYTLTERLLAILTDLRFLFGP